MRSPFDANQALATYAVQGIASKLAIESERKRFAAVLAPSTPTRKAQAKTRATLIGRLFGRSV